MKNTIIGTLAHVDAGKTTLSESMLYTAGVIRHLGRVDHKDAFLDFDQQERERGITIYAKQAIIAWKDCTFTFIDTPGHVDFSSEMERTLQVLDYAILVVNGIDGVQTHTETIWKLLKHYQIPTFIFVNKMDVAYKEEDILMQEIKEHLDDRCINFHVDQKEVIEPIALSNDILLEQYVKLGSLEDKTIAEAIQQRHIFPCYFGSALKMSDIDIFLDGLCTFTLQKKYPVSFRAKVYKITRDEQGTKLTHMKITGGSLKVKTSLSDKEKVDQIRVYTGNTYQSVQEVQAGQVCAVKGLQHIQVGQTIGSASSIQQPVLSSYLNYRCILPSTCDTFTMLKYLRQLQEEDPQLHIIYNEQKEEIDLQVMGEIQIEILKNIIKERFHIDVDFDEGNVNYKETITETIEGVGHYEPLRHYAEVHVLLEPGPLGSGVQFFNICNNEDLDGQYQNLIMSHLAEKEHLGVLSGSPITDIKITLLSGKAHIKHTEGGDFREATYRAVRQGLKATTSILLEPYYQFRLVVPDEYMSKAIYDIDVMHGTYEIEQGNHGTTTIIGKAPVTKMQNYQIDVRSYTKGKGTLTCTLKDYEPCEQQEEIIEKIKYDSEKDLKNPIGSIFCEQGASFFVRWDEVENYMHIKKCWKPVEKQVEKKKLHTTHKIDDTEVKRVFNNIYRRSPEKEKQRKWKKKEDDNILYNATSQVQIKPTCILIDGYNIIYSWPAFKDLIPNNFEIARMKLINIISNYQGYKKGVIIVVFDAYKVKEQQGTMDKSDNIYVVYTKTSQTADSYIEEATHKMASNYNVIVVTSDAMEQWIVIGQGATRMSSREFRQEVNHMHKTTFEDYNRMQRQYRNYALEDIRAWNEIEREDNKEER